MKNLIISATKQEVSKILETYNFVESKEISNLYQSQGLDIFISGVGTAFTIFYLTQLLEKTNYSFVINLGIAGAYNRNLQVGELVVVEQDMFADIGIDDNGIFKTFAEEGFEKENKIWKKSKDNFSLSYKKVKSITLNTTSGSEERINLWKNKFKPDIETMEGAGVYFVCNEMNVSVIQIRAISNYVEPRNKANWDIDKATNALFDFVKTYLIPKK